MSVASAVEQELPDGEPLVEPIAAPPEGAPHKYLIAFAVVLAALMQVIDSSIVNVALPDMMGNLGASLDEIAWVSTGYILANVIIIPLTGWLGDFFGRKRYFVGSIIIFTVTSFMCGASTSLSELVFWRIVQGMGGGALMTVSQAVLFESFPRREAGMAMALFGLGVMVGPTIGPTLGGWLTDNYGWPWIFYVNLPVGVLAAAMIIAYVHDPEDQERPRTIDYIGIALLAVSRRYECRHRNHAHLARAHDGRSGDRLPRAKAPTDVGWHAARRRDGCRALCVRFYASRIPAEQSSDDGSANRYRSAPGRPRHCGLDGSRWPAHQQVRCSHSDRDWRAAFCGGNDPTFPRHR
ncbi:MAG: hypothetical protein DMD72_00195 [Gemmatimonadetes bacterium]|nr:MAG: hypothetical protein DMD72_00195 [Gemmatimonadota bacterium]